MSRRLIPICVIVIFMCQACVDDDSSRPDASADSGIDAAEGGAAGGGGGSGTSSAVAGGQLAPAAAFGGAGAAGVGIGGAAGGGGATETYRIGGEVSGLQRSGLVLRNNDQDDLTVPGNGPFEFTTEHPEDTHYSITIVSQPSGQTCSVMNSSGSVGNSDVPNVAMQCVEPNVLTLEASFNLAIARWDDPARRATVSSSPAHPHATLRLQARILSRSTP